MVVRPERAEDVDRVSNELETTLVAGEAIPLRSGLVFGRDPTADVLLSDSSVSRKHFELRREKALWRVQDLGSKTGTYANGRLFRAHELVYGDLLRAGPFVFRYDGRFLHRVDGESGAGLSAIRLGKRIGSLEILKDITLLIEPGQFVGIIGPSGAGKSTLLDALCGLRPATSGTVLLDGLDLYRHGSILRQEMGYVPQDDIVPVELTVRQSLEFSARLRLPKGTPRADRLALAKNVEARLGLAQRSGVRVGRLSGGQRKRVSVAAELLTRPRLLFLDEPTSGLDPATEFRLMEMLRELASNGCTVLCTTHVMENLHLLDRLVVLQGGRLIYDGDPRQAATWFEVPSMATLYDRIGPETPAWETPPGAGQRPPVRESMVPKKGPARPASLPILMQRQWAILLADWKNLLLLLGQPVLISLLVGWVSTESALALFFAYIATLWFGCNNAAQEIVKELGMYRRERLIGLSRTSYLLSKWLSLGRLTVVQALLLYGVLQLVEWGLEGFFWWQIAALVGTALAGVGVGLAISACSRSVMQAVMLVPILLIPQILFSGFVPPAGEMKTGPYVISQALPSGAAQAIMDVSLFWDRRVTGALRVDYPSTFSNLNRAAPMRNGEVFSNRVPAVRGLIVLAIWSVLSGVVTWGALRLRERG